MKDRAIDLNLRAQSDAPDPHAEAEAQLAAGDLACAVAQLESLAEEPEDARAAALLGAAYYRSEEYAKAAMVLRRAVALSPGDAQLAALLARAQDNVTADVRRPVPEPVLLDAASLLRGPRPGDARAPVEPAKTPSLLTRVRDAVGQLSGKKLGEGIGLLTQLLGREAPSDTPWTSWYRHEGLRATVMLAFRRARLNRAQIFSAYPAGTRVAFHQPAAQPAWTAHARSDDGSWNDPRDPMAGAQGTRFGFNTDPRRTEPETGTRLLTPNPRTVSRALLTRPEGRLKPVPFLNLNAASWIQYMNHDWISYGDPDPNGEPYRIPLDEDDPARQTLKQTHMLVRPTQQDPTRKVGETAPTHVNEVTSWWDGSQVYGSDARTVRALRSQQDGKLRMDPHTGNLPVLPDGVEQTGFRRNWWLGLSMLHTLFAREHNAICDMLKERHPHFDDQRLFDTARLINAAVMAKIHTVEWTPAILPNAALNAAMNANWFGLLTNALRTKDERRTLARINVADPIAGGLVGNAVDNHGVAYSLTREFVSVYRLHSLLPDRIALYDLAGGSEPVRMLSLAEVRQAGSHRISDITPMDQLFYSFGRQHPGSLTLHNYPATLQNLSIPGAGFYDLGAVDVLRDRERGVPRYNQFRRLLGLKALERFEQLTDDPSEVRALREVYGTIEEVDLLIGNLAEVHRPTGFGFGETLFEVFILNASRRLQADRFFTDAYREDVYTEEGLAWIDRATLKTVLLRHHPRLAETGLANIDNAFEPWDTGALDPARHPLRAFDAALRARDRKRKL
ncbi:MAG: peroxidase family protein [Polyangiales bacterium]